MTIFIGHISALQYLFSSGTPERRIFGAHANTTLEPTRAEPKPCQPPDYELIRSCGFPEGITSKQLHVNVADKTSLRRLHLGVKCHIWPGPSRGTYYRIDDTYCVATPEACFAQLADSLTLAQLLELANTLCGSFAPQPYDQPTRYNLQPLTTPDRLRTYVQRLQGKRGLDKARIAAKLASAGSESPMEAKIAAILALSTRHGGMGLPAVQNAEIQLTREARGAGYRDVRRPDFLWPKYGLAMDYESAECHNELQRIRADELRRNELAAMDLRVIVARPYHFRDGLAFAQLMDQVMSAMGKTNESQVRNLPEKRAQVFEQLFDERKQFRPMDMT